MGMAEKNPAAATWEMEREPSGARVLVERTMSLPRS